MWIPVLLFCVGLVLLVKGGDWFVDGASGIAHRFHIPEILIGATVVSIGTTLPEVLVSATSAMTGHGEIAYGNSIGSIICNTALVAAITVTVRPAKVERAPLRLPVIFFFVAAVFYAVVSYLLGYFYLPVGIALLLIFCVYMGISIARTTKEIIEVDDEERAEAATRTTPLWREILLLVVGAALIAVGARLLVDNGTLIAEALGVPEAVIALTFVALGTSLPELVTAITSLVKGHSAMSLGNVIGANFFNLVLVSGVSISLSPFAVPQVPVLFGHPASLVLDIPVMFTVMLLLTVPTLIRGKLSRWQGIALLAIYAAFCVIQFIL